ncbi:SPOR domain-containing protein [Novosphingobium sp.]|uniref:SPOR domain-containing protein n=1 Tax=Novosphingobium sp. TaxID=1874826 RepID=UPI003D0A947E
MTVSHASFRLSRFARGAVLATGATAAMLVSGCASAPRPEKLAEQARDAMHKGNNGKAIALSEQAVRADGRNAGLRLMLANAYLRGGRFESARSAYSDAIALGDDSSRAALGLALADLALGHNRAALDTLNTYSDVIPAADLGLALVMTGQNERGLTVLTTAVRNGKAGPKVRQNLAYGYALSGFWAEARVMAGQDIPANQVDARLESWAAMIRPEDGRRRVATMVGAPLVGDTGQPEALALAHFPAPAGAETAPAKATPVQAAAAELAPVQPAQVATVQTPTASGALARIDLPESRPAAALPVGAHVTDRADMMPAPRQNVASVARTRVAVAMPVKGLGTHVVQIGAYNSDESAHRAWQHILARNPALAGHPSLVTKVNVRGHDFWRLQAAGFGAQATATSACGSWRKRGGACFVMAINVAGQVSGVQTATAQPVVHAPMRLSMNAAPKR